MGRRRARVAVHSRDRDRILPRLAVPVRDGAGRIVKVNPYARKELKRGSSEAVVTAFGLEIDRRLAEVDAFLARG